MAAALSFASAALAQGATAARQLASPALAVKAGRQRGVSVLSRYEKRRQEEQQEMAAAEAAAAKRKKIFRPTASVPTVVDPSLPAGVGVMGRGRAAVNVRLTSVCSDGSTERLNDKNSSVHGGRKRILRKGESRDWLVWASAGSTSRVKAVRGTYKSCQVLYTSMCECV